MPGAAVKGRDRAGGAQLEQAHDWFVLESESGTAGEPIVTVGDTVESHGDAPHAPTPAMVEGEPWLMIEESSACRADHTASCGDRTTGRYWFQLESADDGFRPYLENPGDPCNIEHIPWIMRAKGWHEGAKLMDHWFSGQASTDRLLAEPETSTITMSFILGFADANARYQDLRNPEGWPNRVGIPRRSAIDRLCDQLRNRSMLTGSRVYFDDFGLSPSVLHHNSLQIDNRVVRPNYYYYGSEEYPTLDGLTAALGSFQLLLVVAGYVEPALPDGHQITILKSGVFAHDKYDFEGVQYLGSWDAENMDVTHIDWPWSTGCYVTNGDFNAWREKTGRGGDFDIYTDMFVEEYVDGALTFACLPTAGS